MDMTTGASRRFRQPSYPPHPQWFRSGTSWLLVSGKVPSPETNGWFTWKYPLFKGRNIEAHHQFLCVPCSFWGVFFFCENGWLFATILGKKSTAYFQNWLELLQGPGYLWFMTDYHLSNFTRECNDMLPQKLEEVIGLDHADSAFPLVYLDVPGRKCRAKSSKWLGLMGN